MHWDLNELYEFLPDWALPYLNGGPQQVQQQQQSDNSLLWLVAGCIVLWLVLKK